MTEQELLNQTAASMNTALTIAKLYIDQSSTAEAICRTGWRKCAAKSTTTRALLAG